MKNFLHKTAALVLASAVLIGAVGAAAFEPATSGGLKLADGVTLTSSTIVRENRNNVELVRENVVEYDTSDDSVRPMVAYGKTLYGRSTISKIADYLEDEDLTLVAGINGSFFDMNSGIPYGMIVTEGVLRSSGNTLSVGFYEDGTAIIGTPELEFSMETPDGEITEIFYNKALTKSNGIGLYSADYHTSTRSGMDAYHVILEPVDEDETEIRLGGEIELEMVGMMESSDCGIAEGTFVLSIAENSIYKTALENMRDLDIGDCITITASVDREWEDVYYACGGSDLLIEDGEVCDDFTLDTAEKSAARTAIGIKDDGTVVLYTADGGNGSAGLTLEELAERMLELGCETALNLDGGGSTTLGAIYPGYDSASTVNTPEDGELRACANFIYLVRSTPSTVKQAKHLYLYPYHAAIMRGTAVSLNIRAVDANYMPTDVPEELSFSAMGGTITEEGVFTATTPGKKASIDVEGGSAKGTVELQVIDEPTALTVKKENDKAVLSKLIVAGGSKTELTAEALYYGLKVASQDSCFEWEVDEKLGTVSEQGTFRAANVSAPQTGELTVTSGDVSFSVEVTVSPSDPFVDMKNHWASEYVNTLYFEGVLAGSTGSDGKAYYRPDASMTRQEFMVALMRFMKIDAADYADVELPFDDADKIASWALDAVKASYALEYVGGSKQGKKLYVNPTSTISRQEAMVILARTQELSDDVDDDVLKQFSDHKNVADWARSALAAMVDEGIISGSNGKLNPTGNVKRCEVAKMLYELR